MELVLKPSLICFSQDSISNVFNIWSDHSGKTIGETLDDLCDGRCHIDDIPRITVVNEHDRWITADNRRLWVFRQLESLGRCVTIPVKQVEGYFIPQWKKTSDNNGTSVRVRGDPGGRWHSNSNVEPSVTNVSNGHNRRYRGYRRRRRRWWHNY